MIYDIKEIKDGEVTRTWCIESDLKYGRLQDIFEDKDKLYTRYLVTPMSIIPLEECLGDIERENIC